MVLNDLKSHHIHKAHENVVRKYNNFQNWHRCVHCLDEYFQEDQELIDHNLKEHKEKTVSLSKCEISLASLDDDNENIEIEDDTKSGILEQLQQFQCLKCPQKCDDLSKLCQHYVEKHKNIIEKDWLPCPICITKPKSSKMEALLKDYFYSDDELDFHFEDCHQNIQFVCDFCNTLVKNREEANQHLSRYGFFREINKDKKICEFYVNFL